MEQSIKPDGRSGRRRIQHGPDRRMLAVVDPTPPGEGFLPGELEPLRPEGRTASGPVTDEEALGTARRLERLRAAALGSEPDLPAELPSWLATSEKTVLAFDPRLKALAEAHFLLEGTNFARGVSGLLHDLVAQPPRDPAWVRAHHEAQVDRTAGAERRRASADGDSIEAKRRALAALRVKQQRLERELEELGADTAIG
ncbi:hypothetical protein [Catellatospora sp. NPDC049133]|uniref:hypothetical protein n=1 Tax=Catellatospora sp. NPDC049133 TaxID=3155499 RepID=UPI0033F1A72D